MERTTLRVFAFFPHSNIPNRNAFSFCEAGGSPRPYLHISLLFSRGAVATVTTTHLKASKKRTESRLPPGRIFLFSFLPDLSGLGFLGWGANGGSENLLYFLCSIDTYYFLLLRPIIWWSEVGGIENIKLLFVIIGRRAWICPRALRSKYTYY